LGELREANSYFDVVIRNDAAKGTETAAQAQWRIGETLFLQEKWAEAIQAYYRVESQYNYPYWQAAALLQAGKCQEKLNNQHQAVILYGNLLKRFPDSEFAQTARERLAAIDRQVNRRKREPILR
jgi:TolA-binding protein